MEKDAKRLYQYVVQIGDPMVYNIGAYGLENANVAMTQIIKEKLIPQIIEAGDKIPIWSKCVAIQDLQKFGQEVGVQTIQFNVAPETASLNLKLNDTEPELTEKAETVIAKKEANYENFASLLRDHGYEVIKLNNP